MLLLLCGWKQMCLLILAEYEGHSQFPSALDGSVYSELRQADEALGLLILPAQSDGWRVFVVHHQQNKVSNVLRSSSCLGLWHSTRDILGQHMLFTFVKTNFFYRLICKICPMLAAVVSY